MGDILEDLVAEHDYLDGLVGGLSAPGWAGPTPAEGWTVLDTISHLAYFDERAFTALVDPVAFAAHAEDVLAHGFGEASDVALGRRLGRTALLAEWRSRRTRLLAGLRAADPSARVPWYGPAMSLRSFATARLMETWAHGVDVADALGAPLSHEDRLRNVCHLCVGARAFSFFVHGAPDPGDPVRVEVTGPHGDLWTWGAEDAPHRVTGTALDLALLVTQRRHRSDTALTVEGDVAELWLSVAQAFAGPAGGGRAPLGSFGATSPDTEVSTR